MDGSAMSAAGGGPALTVITSNAYDTSSGTAVKAAPTPSSTCHSGAESENRAPASAETAASAGYDESRSSTHSLEDFDIGSQLGRGKFGAWPVGRVR